MVDGVELEFGPGLNVLTGETGAGKSIVLGALSLLAGARASAQLIRDGRDEAARRGGVRHLPPAGARGRRWRPRPSTATTTSSWCGAASSADGRGRARVAGQLVPVDPGRALRGASRDLQPARFPGAAPARAARPPARPHGRARGQRAAVGAGLRRRAGARRRAGRGCARDAAERARRRDFLAFQVDEIDAAGLDPAELAVLRGHRSQLAHAGRLQEDGAARGPRGLTGDPRRRRRPRRRRSARRGGAALESARCPRIPARRVADGCAGAGRAARRRLDLERHSRAHRGRSGDARRGRGAAAPGREAPAEVRPDRRGRCCAPRRVRPPSWPRRRGRRARGRSGRRAERPPRRRSPTTRSGLSAGAGEGSRATRWSAVQANLRELAMPDAQFAVALDPVDAPEDLPCGAHGRREPRVPLRGQPGRGAAAAARGGIRRRALPGLPGPEAGPPRSGRRHGARLRRGRCRHRRPGRRPRRPQAGRAGRPPPGPLHHPPAPDRRLCVDPLPGREEPNAGGRSQTRISGSKATNALRKSRGWPAARRSAKPPSSTPDELLASARPPLSPESGVKPRRQASDPHR